jgi:hypothetical protein
MKISLLPYLFAIIAGFALIRVPMTDTFLESLEPAFDIIGLISVVVFAVVIIIAAFKYLLNHKVG